MQSVTVPKLKYYGLSSFELETEAVRFLIDPWVITPDWTDATIGDFENVDAVFITHGAYDHVGDAVPIVESTDAEVYTEPAVADHLVSQGIPEDRIQRVIWGNAFEVDGVEIRVLETRHLSYFESDTQHLSGIPLGFHFEFPDTSLYYVGDTSLFSDLKLFVEVNNPDIILLPIGSAPGDLAPLPPRDAAITASWLNVETVIPVHYVPGSNEVDHFRTELNTRTDDAPDVVELGVSDEYPL